jgi:hypothetical protein
MVRVRAQGKPLIILYIDDVYSLDGHVLAWGCVEQIGSVALNKIGNPPTPAIFTSILSAA